MNRPVKKVLSKEVRNFLGKNPVADEGIKAAQGAAEFYEVFDSIWKGDNFDPYEYFYLIHWYRSSKSKFVLDVSCGNSYALSRYAIKGAKVFGIDLTQRAVDFSQKRYKLSKLSGEFQMTDGEKLPFSNNVFDIACSVGVLHHNENHYTRLNQLSLRQLFFIPPLARILSIFIPRQSNNLISRTFRLGSLY